MKYAKKMENYCDANQHEEYIASINETIEINPNLNGCVCALVINYFRFFERVSLNVKISINGGISNELFNLESVLDFVARYLRTTISI